MASRPDPRASLATNQIRQADMPALANLLQYESDVRRQPSVDELSYFLANETRRIIDYGQLFVLREAAMGDDLNVYAVSSLAMVDRNAPLVHAIEQVFRRKSDNADRIETAWRGDAAQLSDDPAIADYPFHDWLWQPMLDRAGKAFGGFLFARATPWLETDLVRTARISEVSGHAWLALTGGKPIWKLPKLDSRKRRWLAIGAAIIALFPVRMTALAPVEVVPSRPFFVSAPYAGIIQRIEVAPNAIVKQGQPVLIFEDIKVRNELQQASERLSVAKAKLERATSASFSDAEQARDIAPLRAEYDLAKADQAYARDLMGKSQIVAPRSGMAIYSDRRDWEGRAVNPGDPILQLADPADVSFRIDLPAREQLRLEPGSKVKVWLDSQPLWALNGRVTEASYQARPTAEGILAFAVNARPSSDAPRIGSRGTAKLYGQWVPFSYALLRRPIASVRQFVGL